MRKLVVLCAALMVLLSIPGALAINVDGDKSANEWDENWSFGQTEGTGYDSDGPFGDRMVIFQNGMWYDTDPMDDSGTGFDESMATVGPNPSGYDIANLYMHYDPATQTIYGLSEVYGTPGDLDGDGNVSTELSKQDGPGAPGPAGTGIGPFELWQITIETEDGDITILSLSNNNWTVPLSDHGVVYGDVNTQFNTVYEIEMDASNLVSGLAPGSVLEVTLTAGGVGDVDPETGGLLGEDIATIFLQIPEPDIDIEKFTNGVDADDANDAPELTLGDTVTWRYNVSNTGDIPLENIAVLDSELVDPIDNLVSGDINGDEVLQLEEVWVYEATGTAECGDYENIGFVFGNGIFLGIPVDDEDLSHYFVDCEPDIMIKKYVSNDGTNWHDGALEVSPGDTIYWKYDVTNTGKVPLSNIVVTDDQGVVPLYQSGDDNNDDVLQLDEVWIYMASDDSGVQCPVNYQNVGEVTGDFDTGQGIIQVSDSDPSRYFCQPTDVPLLTPLGMIGLIGMLGMIGIVGLRRRD